ncbi:MAG TPA: hypothetical protein VKU83_05030 [Puia sp.]|nr:hypothetical protein [Puia sp.]
MAYFLAGRHVARVLLISVVPFAASAQQTPPKKKKHFVKEVYGSWGYNGEFYTNSTIHVSQSALGNDYNFGNVRAHDHPGWNEGLFSKALSIPQYNYRLGFLLNEEKGWGFEINFDHTKYIFADQNVTVRGKLNFRNVDTTVAFNAANGFYYYLNNGANFLLFNVTKKWHLLTRANGRFKLDLLGKFGVGPVIPHTQNELFGQKNDEGFQFGGWNTGAEASLRATFCRYVYLEFSNKLDYARYHNLNVYMGAAHQAFGTEEMILSLGFVLPTSHH